ncbi:UNVERIFIED_CONTAM: Retrovirus-related Pol polyprotein from transposon RE2 [Sesamum latifolium]|uniref:Retrovirus-related Pol polyprotein from transposon RE2 n=1 Tax=Sesamum latifolium TaxID=2727402 RepID=A0AAW2UG76_9LAMI
MSEATLQGVKHYLDGLFTIKDLGHAKYFLGLELARLAHGLHVMQHKYLQDILQDASMLDAKSASTPFPSGLKLTLDEGSLLPLPDRLQFTGIVPPQNTLSLSAFSDASWASCPDSRCSITGFCVFLGSSLVSWKTKKQARVSRSSAKAKYRALASTVCELLWISYLLREFPISVTQPISFWCDNKAALHITTNPVFHEHTKHLDIDRHLVRDHFKCGYIAPTHVRGPDQPADIFTKALPVPSFVRLLSKLGFGFHPPALGGAIEICSCDTSYETEHEKDDDHYLISVSIFPSV